MPNALRQPDKEPVVQGAGFRLNSVAASLLFQPTKRSNTPLFPLFIAVALVVVIGFLSWSAWRTVLYNNAEVERTRRVLAGTNKILYDLTNAETGQRGFLLTAKESYLAPYQSAQKDIPSDLAELRRVTDVVPGQATSIERLESLIQQKLDELQLTIDLARAGKRSAALAMVDTGHGKAVMDEIRRVGAQIETAAASQFAAASERNQQSQTRPGLVATLGSGVLYILLVLATVAIHRNIHERDRSITAQKQLERELTVRNESLAKANEELQHFAFAVAHDLQAPLRNVSSMTTLLAKRLRRHLDADSTQLVRFIEAGAKQMGSLIESLLAFSRAGGDSSPLQPIDSAEVLSTTLTTLSAQIHELAASVVADPLPTWSARTISSEECSRTSSRMP